MLSQDVHIHTLMSVHIHVCMHTLIIPLFRGCWPGEQRGQMLKTTLCKLQPICMGIMTSQVHMKGVEFASRWPDHAIIILTKALEPEDAPVMITAFSSSV